MNIQLLKSEVQKYIDENFIQTSTPMFAKKSLHEECWALYLPPSKKHNDSDEDCDITIGIPSFLRRKDSSVDVNLLKNLEPTFSQTLFKFIKEKGISETDCYKNANLDRRLFSKIRSNDSYQPRKNTVFALIIGLKLNLDEAEKLLDSAGYSISHSIKLDTIMEYLIKRQVYDILIVNEILYSFECQILGQTC